ncbi:MAG: hypothetical protein JEZ04_18625 [Spirochaetales bacterium]|nr:hypothetical protein [Spirochaetales bacterium]
MSIVFYYYLLCILIPRLFYQWQEEKSVGLKKHIIIFLVEVLLLFPLISGVSIIVLLVLMIIYHFSIFLLERIFKNIFIRRIIEIILIIIISSFVFGTILENLEFNTVSVKITNIIMNNNAILQNWDMVAIKKSVFYFFGIIMLINEWNNLIRFILGLIKIEPHQENIKEADRKELGKGKIIGIIERILFFFFVITGNYASIGFILTAKGITRFKNLDNRDFAEYVLIGTLLSSAISIFWAYIIKQGMISI